MHGVGNVAPILDSSQNVELLGGERSDGSTIIRFRRKWNTCDKDDYVIGDQTVKLIWAYGKEDAMDAAFIPAYHEGKRGIKLVNLRLVAMHSKLPEDVNPPDPNVKYFDILMDNVRLRPHLAVTLISVIRSGCRFIIYAQTCCATLVFGTQLNLSDS